MKGVYIEYMGESIALPLGETLLGRDAGCMFRFNDPGISRRHARFIHRHDEVFIEDLGSANGTLLNGRTVTAAIRIHDRDTITVGSRDLRVRFSEVDDDAEISTVRVPILARAAAALKTPRVGSMTAEMPAVTPPPLTADERCPRCSAVVNFEDEACGNCQYRWGKGPLSAQASLNRRRKERVSVSLKVRYASAQHEGDATTLDISENGVFACTHNIDAVGSACTLTLHVENGPPLNVSGVVRRVVAPGTAHAELVGMGIELVDIGLNERAWLVFMIDRLAKEET